MPIARANIWRSAASRCRASSLAAAALALLAAGALPAQTGRPTREEVNRAAPIDAPPSPSRLTVEDETARAPCPLAQPGATSIALMLHSVRFDHLIGLDAAALRPAYEAYLGKRVDGAALCAIRDAAAAVLTQAGYVAAVEIPPQDGADGAIRFSVIQARIVRFEMTGARASRPIAAYLAKLRDRPVFNVHEAERYLLLARDLPGYDVELTLRSAGAAPGEVIGVVAVKRRRLLLAANLQDYGSHELGRWGALVSAELVDLAGGDRLSAGLFSTLQPREQTVVQADYDVRLGGEGAAIGARLTYARTNPTLRGADLTSRTWVGAVEASYPLVWRRALRLRAAAGLELVDQRLRDYGTPLTDDRLRSAYVRLDAQARTGTVRLSGVLEFRRGLGVLGAGSGCGGAPDYPRCTSLPVPSRLDADFRAGLVRFNGAAEWSMLPRVTLVVAPRLQRAFAPLVSYEQFSGGAYTIGRGYDPGSAIGDSGAGSSLELRYGTLRLLDRRLTLEPFVFGDGAWAWNRAGGYALAGTQRILSAGGGVRANIVDRARLELLAAVPLERGPYQAKRGDARVLVSLTTRLGR